MTRILSEMELPSIYFMDRKLPRYGYFLDNAAKILHADHPETKDWFWQFVICMGIRKSEPAKTVYCHTATLKDALEVMEVSDIKELFTEATLIDPHTSSNVLRDWRESVDLICTLSSELITTNQECYWNGISINSTEDVP